MSLPQRLWYRLVPLLLLATALGRLTRAAHLPAVRRAAVPIGPQEDSKRVLASRLIRSADRHKERSLRDVLGESDQPPVAASKRTRRDEERRRARAEGAARDRVYPDREAGRQQRTGQREEEDVHEDDGDEEEDRNRIRTMSELFQWAINNTVRSSNSSRLFTPTDHDTRPAADVDSRGADTAVEVELPDEDEERSILRQTAGVSGRKALPPGDPRLTRDSMRESVRNTRRKREAASASSEAGGTKVDEDLKLLNSASESEFDIMRRNVHVLDVEGMSPNKKVSALLMLEELCHSIDNGRDLQISGGISPLLGAMKSRHDKVRASAAWALATCCQNNPAVQNASLSLEAVPMLSKLAAHDVSPNVRSKALFALNAMLELESARVAFEELPYAIDAVRNALIDTTNFRATRRALNLTELLVQKNLDAWKTQLEAWDIPVLIERLMRSHPDIDVRESAARTIAALDGRPVA